MTQSAYKNPEIPDHQLLCRIGRGSYGEVWLGRNVFDQFRAIKIIYRDSFEDDRPYQRELNGIRAFEPLSRTHESQLDILHVGRHESGFFYVMELGDDIRSGPTIDPDQYKPLTLQHLLNERNRLPVSQCIEIALALARALDHLHCHGLVHRDIKPSNVIFVQGRPKLADIGLVSSAKDSVTAVGTMGYLPPEGVGKVQGDLYALGKVLYEMATGRDRQEFPEWPTEEINFHSEGLFVELNEIILKACEPNLKHRYASARGLIDDLEDLEAGKSIRRYRILERRLRYARRIAAVLIGIIGLVTAAFFIQRHQTRRVEGLLTQLSQKEALARDHLNNLQIGHAVRMMEEEDFGGALLWAVRALVQEANPQAPTAHSLRVESLLKHHPVLDAVYALDSGIKHASFSPEDRYLAAADQDGTVRVWDLHSDRLVLDAEHEAVVDQITFSPDQRLILTASHDHSAGIWDLESGGAGGVNLKHQDQVHAARFSPVGRLVATASEDGTARLWHTETKEELVTAMQHGGPVVMARFSPDGRFLMTAASNHIKSPHWGEIRWAQTHLWETRSGAPAMPPIRHQNPLAAGAFSPDGNLFATPYQANALRVYRIETLEPTQTIIQHAARITTVAFSPDSKIIASGSFDQSVKVSDSVTGNLLYPPLHHRARVTSIAFSPEGDFLATTSLDGRARIWEVETGHPVTPWILHGGNVLHIAFSHDGSRVLTPGNGTLRIWKWKPAWMQDQLVLNHESSVSDICLSAQGKLLASGSVNGRVRIWDAINGKQIMEIQKHDSPVTTICFSRDGKWLVSGSERGGIRVWDVNNQQDHPFKGSHRSSVVQAGFDPSGQRLLTASKDHTAVIWELETSRKLATLKHENVLNDAQWNQDGTLVATASDDSSVEIWDANTGQPIGPYISHGNEVLSARFSPDGKSILTATEARYLGLFEVETSMEKVPLMRHLDTVIKAIFSPSGRLIASAGVDRNARLWVADSGLPAAPPMNHSSSLRDVVFSWNEKWLATGTEDGQVRVWEVDSGHPITPVMRVKGPVRRVLFGAEDRRLYIASEDPNVRIIPLDVHKRPLEQLTLQAQVSSGRRISERGTMIDLSSEDLLERMNQLLNEKPQKANAR